MNNIDKYLIMRKLLLIIALVLVAGGAFGQTSEPKLKFLDKRVVNYGKVMEGEKVHLKIRYTNEGAEPLLITRVFKTCSCTAVKFPDKPLAKGKVAAVDIEIDTSGKRGEQIMVVTLYTNAKRPSSVIRVEMEVVSLSSKTVQKEVCNN